MRKPDLIPIGGSLIFLIVMVSGCAARPPEDNLPKGSVSFDAVADNEYDSDLVKAWKITSFATAYEVFLLDLTWEIRDKETNHKIFSGTARSIDEYQVPSGDVEVLIWDYFNDGFGSSDRILLKVPYYGGFELRVVHGNRLVWDAGFFVREMNYPPSDNGGGGDGRGGGTPTAENVIEITLNNHIGYEVKCDVYIEMEYKTSFNVAADSTGSMEIKGYKGVVLQTDYAVIGADNITIDGDAFFDVNEFVNINLYTEGSSMNTKA